MIELRSPFVPSNNKHIWLLQQQSVIFDFIVEVPLADSEATEFVFSFWMYDVDDLLYSHPDIIPVNTDNGKTRFDNVKHITLDIMFSVCNLYLMYFGNIAPLSPCNKRRIT